MLNAFVSPNNKDPMVCAMLVTVIERDPILRVRRDYGGPTMSLNQAMKELAQRGRPMRRRSICLFLSFG